MLFGEMDLMFYRSCPMMTLSDFRYSELNINEKTLYFMCCNYWVATNKG